jgi:hypothetical protein
MTDDINHTSSASALSSAMYNSDLKSSSSSSLQQPCGAENNFFYNDNNNNGNDYSQPQSHNNYNNNQQQQQYLLHQEQQAHGPLTNPSLHRSIPIAIQRRSPSNRKKEIGDHHLSRSRTSIYDDDDDNDSDIDVEGDAIKLRRKYGNKIVQTYQQESSILPSSTSAAGTTATRFRNHNRSLSTSSASILNAPYFGSLSRSTNQILSLPPMSLGGGDNNNDNIMYDDDGQVVVEPPESIISYGSLRDSHERGRFLDGPSSYREPMSGKIRQLDHRLRYHGSRQQPAGSADLNIGERLRERLQQSRKLKELRQKEEDMKKKKSSNNNNKNKEGGLYIDNNNNNDEGNDNNDDDDTTNNNIGESQDQQKMAATSSLSAMMNGVSQSVSPPEGYNSSLGSEILMPIETEELLPSPRRMMLSTSLTAFELLKTSNKDNIISDYDKRLASAGGQHGQPTSLLSSLAPLVTTDSNKNNNTGLSNLMSLNTNTTTTTTTTTTTEIRKPHNTNNNDGFQLLARSMSDPSPRFYHNHHHSLQQSSGTTTTTSADNINMFLPANTTNNNQTNEATNNNAIQQVPPYNNDHQLLRENHHTSSSPFISDHNNDTIMFNGNGSRSQLDHDPNTDGAFGDMDME